MPSPPAAPPLLHPFLFQQPALSLLSPAVPPHTLSSAPNHQQGTTNQFPLYTGVDSSSPSPPQRSLLPLILPSIRRPPPLLYPSGPPPATSSIISPQSSPMRNSPVSFHAASPQSTPVHLIHALYQQQHPLVVAPPPFPDCPTLLTEMFDVPLPPPTDAANAFFPPSSSSSWTFPPLPRHASQLEQFAQTWFGSYGQYAGTAAMGSVVDLQFRVKGVEGLAVVDASVFEQAPRVPLAATLMAMGRYAAELTTS
eukprot:GHVS01026591.1.p1 GENE.GHVS01026591.1~~GHVS01026591.1.p1  ORF type:complete len:279 (-),score=76.58 GHVS01026591.1:496-1254(-)